MRTIVSGLNGWVRMSKSKSQNMRTVDTAITVTGTLLVAATWALLAS